MPSSDTSPPSEIAAHAVNADGRVAVNVPCVQCGYNLRTLPHDAVCPECAQPVADALDPRLLRFAPPAWIRAVARGVLWLMIALGASLFVVPMFTAIINIGLLMLAESGQTDISTTSLIRIGATVDFVLSEAVIIIAVIAAFRFTRPDPSTPSEQHPFTARRVARLGALVLLLPEVGNLFLSYAVPPIPNLTTGGPPPNVAALAPAMAAFAEIAMGVGLVLLVVSLIPPITLLGYLVVLLRRLPNARLVLFGRVTFWGVLVCTGLLWVGAATFVWGAAPFVTRSLRAAAITAANVATQPAGGSATQAATAPTVGVSRKGISVRISQPTTTPTTGPATMPATAPVGGRPPIPPSVAMSMLVGLIITGVSGLGFVAFAISGVVLFIMACSALFRSAREAEQNAKRMATWPRPNESGTQT